VLKDGSIASGSYDTTIAIWNAMNGSLLRKLKGHSKCITCLAALNLNGMLASGSWDTTLMIWNQTNGRLMHVLRGHDDSVYTLAVLSEERLASGSRDFTIIIWNYTTKADSIARGEFRLAHRLRGHTHFVIALTVLRDISIGQLISGSYDETIKIWNPNSGDLIRNLKVCNGPVLSLIPISDSQLAVGTTKEIKILNLQNGQQLKKFTEKSENVYSMVLLEANILVSSSVQRIVFRNLTNGEIIKRVDTAHNGVILCLALLSEQNLLASGSQDNSVKLWNTREIND
jgi:WD40 repeat protein